MCNLLFTYKLLWWEYIKFEIIAEYKETKQAIKMGH